MESTEVSAMEAAIAIELTLELAGQTPLRWRVLDPLLKLGEGHGRLGVRGRTRRFRGHLADTTVVSIGGYYM